MAEALAFEGEVERTKHAAIDFAALRRKADAAEAVCGRTASPAVFCHNDLLSGNILALGLPRDQCLASVAAEDVALQLIDFEYSGYSHRGFDWGAHLWPPARLPASQIRPTHRAVLHHHVYSAAC